MHYNSIKRDLSRKMRTKWTHFRAFEDCQLLFSSRYQDTIAEMLMVYGGRSKYLKKPEAGEVDVQVLGISNPLLSMARRPWQFY